jgi:hypothetical protein
MTSQAIFFLSSQDRNSLLSFAEAGKIRSKNNLYAFSQITENKIDSY